LIRSSCLLLIMMLLDFYLEYNSYDGNKSTAIEGNSYNGNRSPAMVTGLIRVRSF